MAWAVFLEARREIEEVEETKRGKIEETNYKHAVSLRLFQLFWFVFFARWISLVPLFFLRYFYAIS